MSKSYKLEFEVVISNGNGSRFYTGEKPNCKPSQVPDEFWSKVEKQDSDPFAQYHTLKKWAETGEELIRNVKLSEAINSSVWKEVNP